MDLTKDAVEYHGRHDRRAMPPSRPPEPTDEHRRPPPAPLGHAAPPKKVTQARVILSEWTKLRSLRSTVSSLLAAVAFIVGLAVLVPTVTRRPLATARPRRGARLRPDRAQPGRRLPRPAGDRRARRPAHHRRVRHRHDPGDAWRPSRAGCPVLWAKAIVFAAVTARADRARGPGVPSSSGSRSSRASTCRLARRSGRAAGRHRRGALPHRRRPARARPRRRAAQHRRRRSPRCSALLFVLPIIVRFLPSSWADPIAKYLPSTAGQAITHVHPDPAALAPWTGFALFCGYAAVVLAGRGHAPRAATPGAPMSTEPELTASSIGA